MMNSRQSYSQAIAPLIAELFGLESAALGDVLCFCTWDEKDLIAARSLGVCKNPSIRREAKGIIGPPADVIEGKCFFFLPPFSISQLTRLAEREPQCRCGGPTALLAHPVMGQDGVEEPCWCCERCEKQCGPDRVRVIHPDFLERFGFGPCSGDRFGPGCPSSGQPHDDRTKGGSRS